MENSNRAQNKKVHLVFIRDDASLSLAVHFLDRTEKGNRARRKDAWACMAHAIVLNIHACLAKDATRHAFVYSASSSI
jgi:hypothetical protein